MTQPRPDEGSRIVVLSGVGLSIDYQRFKDATWQGHTIHELQRREMWDQYPDLVRAYYDERRIDVASVIPSPAHDALARLQHVLGPKRCMLVTQSIDGLLHKAAAHEAIETRGSLFRLRCANDDGHPRVGIFGAQDPARTCGICSGPLRPDAVFEGEPFEDIGRIHLALQSCDFFMAVGTSGRKQPAAGFVSLAHESGAYCIEVNPNPTSTAYDEVVNQVAETALPKVFAKWLGDEVT
jgi:NAD-dependent deacetylase